MSNQLEREWQLQNTGTGGGVPGVDLDVVPAWQKVTGKGVKIAVADDGFQLTNPAFAGRVDTANAVDYATGGQDPTGNPGDRHGTNVAGVALGGADSGGPVGVAPDATLLPLRITFGGPVEPVDDSSQSVDDLTADAKAVRQAFQAGADVMNNSWGIGYLGAQNLSLKNTRDLDDAINDAVTKGRNGLGTSIVFAAGNEGKGNNDVSFNQVNADPEVITVGAIASNGLRSGFSTPGAGVLVVAPGSSVVTVERTDGPNPNGDGTTSTDGTSFAAPGVAGVVALMYQANPLLGWRDVQEILADTARVPAGESVLHTGDFFPEGEGNDWNGGARHFGGQSGMGYGLVDAAAAVRVAATWTKQSTSANETKQSGTAKAETTAFPGFYQGKIHISDEMRVESLQVGFLNSDINIADLQVSLTSPDGVTQKLFSNPGAMVPPGLKMGTPSVITPDVGLAGQVVTSRGFLGAMAEGDWTLTISGNENTNDKTFEGWSLNLNGGTAPTAMVLTDEFASVAKPASTLQIDGTTALAASPRSTMTASDTMTSINAAAVTKDLFVDLAGGASKVAGVDATFNGFHTVVGGAGSTVIYGTDKDDTMVAGDGNTTMVGRGGHDLFTTGSGFNQVFTGDGASSVVAKGADTISAGNGGAEVFAQGRSTLVANGSGRLTFVGGSGAATVMGGAGTVTGFGGTGAGLLGGGAAGGNVLVGGAGADTLMGGGTGDTLFAKGAANQVLVAGAGNETLTGGFSSGDNVFFAGGAGTQDLITGGGGNDVIMTGAGQTTITGGAGADLFGFSAARGGGSAVVFDFNQADGDRLSLVGYGAGERDRAIAGVNVSSGGSIMQLSDGTTITLVGVQSVTQSMFA